MKKIVLVLAVLLVSVSACKNPFLKKMLVEEESVSPAVQVPKHTITFGVEGGTGGSLKAEVDGNEITTGNLVEQGKSVVFTTEPDSGYVLEQWTKGGAVIAEAGTDKTYTHTVTADADIKVKFQSLFVEGGASLILSPDKLDISVKAVTSDGSAVKTTDLPCSTESPELISLPSTSAFSEPPVPPSTPKVMVCLGT